MNSSWVTSLILIRHLGKFSYSVYKLREFLSNQPSLHLLYFSTYSSIKNSLPYPKHMLRTHYISMSLATLFVSLFVNREPQQIFMGENTECWANLVRPFPVTLLHIYWVCQYKLFLISEGWQRLLNLQNLHCNIIGVIINVLQQYCI